MHLPAELLASVLDDYESADIPDRTKAALDLLSTQTLRPEQVTADFLDQLRKRGLDDEAIRAVAAVGFHFNLMNRFADAFDFEVPVGRQATRMAKIVNFTGRRTSAVASEDYRSQANGRSCQTNLVEGRQHLLNAPGLTSTDRRSLVNDFVQAEWGVGGPVTSTGSAEIDKYLAKLARSAYKIVDGDLDAMRSAGFVDEAIYEITVVGAVAAAMIGIEAVYDAMFADV